MRVHHQSTDETETTATHEIMGIELENPSMLAESLSNLTGECVCSRVCA